MTPVNLGSTLGSTLQRLPLINTEAQLDWFAFLAAFFL